MKDSKIPTNQKRLKALILSLRLLAFLIFLYLIALPFYPKIEYKLKGNTKDISEAKDLEKVAATVTATKNKLPQSEFAVSPNRLIIPKIMVNAPITATDNEAYGLSLGSWLYPKGSTPDKGGNTILTGHRFKYLPPSNLTFYLLDKLEIGDVVTVIWKNKDYFYKVRQIKTVPETDLSPYDKSDKPILTMFTCTPIFSTSHRLVVISDLISEKDDQSGK